MKKKLIRVTTADISLAGLLKGQLRFLNREFEVVGLASDTGVLASVGEREGIRVINVPMHREISIWSDLICLFKLIRLFRKEKPFIVHSNTPKGSLLSMMAALISGVPHRIYTVTGLRYQGVSGISRWVLRTMERITCLCANKVIPEGQGVKSTLLSDHITRKPLEVIHNGNISGIDTSFFSVDSCFETRSVMRNKLGIDNRDFAFIFIGRIVRDKGMNELADAMRNLSVLHPECKLILVGSFETELDPLLPGNEGFFKSSPNVVFVGHQQDVRPYLVAADALVFPSYREGFPNVVMQAGAMGLPSIVTDINGCNEIIVNGKNGRIIPPKDEAELESTMTWFIENQQEVASMAGRAVQMIKARYEQKDVWYAIMNMYLSLDR